MISSYLIGRYIDNKYFHWRLGILVTERGSTFIVYALVCAHNSRTEVEFGPENFVFSSFWATAQRSLIRLVGKRGGVLSVSISETPACDFKFSY